MSSLGLRWALTVVFAALGGYCLLRCALPASWHDGQRWSGRVSDGTHVAMSAAMVAMLWALTDGDRWGIQMAAFGAATAWYLVRAVAGRRSRHDRIALVHQGVAMGAMFWMFFAVSGLLDTSEPAMPGMNMPDAAHSATGRAVTLGLAGYLALAALWWLWAGVRLAPLSAGRLAVPRPANSVLPAPVRVLAAAAAPGLAEAPAPAGGGANRSVPRVFGPVGQAGCQMLMAAAMCLALLTPM